MTVVPIELLEELAAEVRTEAKPPPSPSANGNGSSAFRSHANGAGEYAHRLKVGAWLDARGIAYRLKPRVEAKGRTVYVLTTCPFDSTHGDPDSCIMQDAHGALSAKCLHDSCKDRGWQQFKEAIGAPEPEHYDPPMTRVRSGKATANGRRGTPPPSPPKGNDARGMTGTQIILAYFRERYGPGFRRVNAIICGDGMLLTRAEACSVPTSALITRLATATDAPKYAGGALRESALPAFFRTWAQVAWGDLLSELPDEDDVETGTAGCAVSADELRRMVTDALLSEIVLGDVRRRSGVTQTERRSAIDWCQRFARVGPWRSIRSKRLWCKLVDLGEGEVCLKVALRHELFAQLKADRRLCELGANTFRRRMERHGLGCSTRKNRPQGMSAVVLSDELVADLTAGMSDDEPHNTDTDGG